MNTRQHLRKWGEATFKTWATLQATASRSVGFVEKGCNGAEKFTRVQEEIVQVLRREIFKNFWINRNNFWLRASLTESSWRTGMKWKASKIDLVLNVSHESTYTFFWDGSCEELENFWIPGQDFLFYGYQIQNTRLERTHASVNQWVNFSRIHLKLFIKHNLKQNISIKI